MEAWLENFARANFQRSADTAHDLKTPLNVAVLNLELLRMRLRKIAAAEDAKAADCMAAIEAELRRMGQIFDSFFLLSTPPRDAVAPQRIDAAAVARDAASTAGLEPGPEAPAQVLAHPERLRQMYRLFYEGAPKLIIPESCGSTMTREGGRFAVVISGALLTGATELSKAFKFYYSDRDGNPDLSLAVARLIAETYGGDLEAVEDHGRVGVRLTLPLGEQ